MLNTKNVNQSRLLQLRQHGTDGNKGEGDISNSLGKDPVTGKKLPIEKRGEILLGIKNLNKQVKFFSPIDERTSTITCRHLCLYALQQRLRNNNFKLYKAFKDENAIFERIGLLEKRLRHDGKNIYRIADEVYIFYHESMEDTFCSKKWKKFLEANFLRLKREEKNGDRFFCLLNTKNHRMMLEGVIGRNNADQLFYRLKFYDPNQTVLTRTYESTDLGEICAKTSLDFLNEEDFEKYEANLVNVAVYYQDNRWVIKERPAFNSKLTHEDLKPEVLSILWTAGITPAIDQFFELADPLDNNALFELLSAKDDQGDTALSLAMGCNQYATVTKLVSWLMTRSLTQEQLFELLKAPAPSGYTALEEALMGGRYKVVEAFINACSYATFANKITSEQLLALLDTQGLYYALQDGHHKCVTAFIKAISKIPQLNSDVIMKFFLAEHPQDKRPGLWMALQHHHVETVKAFIEGCTYVHAKNKITDEQLMTLLRSEYKGTSALPFTLSGEGNGESVTAFMKAVIGIPQLTDKDIVELFLAKSGQGLPGLAEASKLNHSQNIAAFIHGCSQAVVEKKITIDQLILLLESSAEKLTSLSIALYKGNAEAIAAFMQALIDLLNKGQLSLTQFINSVMAEIDKNFVGIRAAEKSYLRTKEEKYQHILRIYKQFLKQVCDKRNELACFRREFSSDNKDAHANAYFLSDLLKKIQQHLSRTE